MRVLWLSPWLRPLARVQVEALIARGHDVLLVTTDRHPESGPARAYEVVLDDRPKTVGTWAPWWRARGRVAAFGADVAVTELVRDPRWIALTGRVPRVRAVHDDRPHDPRELRPAWERATLDRWAGTARRTVAFSRYVADRLPGSPLIVPLTSDLDESQVPPVVAADDRRDFVALGRLKPYKNLAVTLAAWAAHAAGPSWRGDDLVLLGAGDVADLGPLPPHVRHLAGEYRYADVVPLLARAKGSLVNYRKASQSGVQVLSLQLAVPTIASPVGALPEYQPPGAVEVGVDDVAALTAALDALADPAGAAARGAAARAYYEQRLRADVVAARWEQVLTDVLR